MMHRTLVLGGLECSTFRIASFVIESASMECVYKARIILGEEVLKQKITHSTLSNTFLSIERGFKIGYFVRNGCHIIWTYSGPVCSQYFFAIDGFS